jgi:hypothetical protein
MSSSTGSDGLLAATNNSFPEQHDLDTFSLLLCKNFEPSRWFLDFHVSIQGIELDGDRSSTYLF